MLEDVKKKKIWTQTLQKVRIVRDNPMVVSKEPMDFVGVAIVRLCIDRIAINCHHSFGSERFGKTLWTSSISHARAVRIMGTIRPMDHAMMDDFKQVRMMFGIWPCCRNDGVDLFWIKRPELREKTEKKVHVRKATFLELNRMNLCNSVTKDVPVHQVGDKQVLV
jgi:hypothetical protein